MVAYNKYRIAIHNPVDAVCIVPITYDLTIYDMNDQTVGSWRALKYYDARDILRDYNALFYERRYVSKEKQLYKFSILTHKRLWDWIVNNIDKGYREWNEEEHKKGVLAFDTEFPCKYAKLARKLYNVKDFDDVFSYCEYCPFNLNGCHKEDTKNPVVQWNYGKRTKEIAEQIRDLPLKNWVAELDYDESLYTGEFDYDRFKEWCDYHIEKPKEKIGESLACCDYASDNELVFDKYQDKKNECIGCPIEWGYDERGCRKKCNDENTFLDLAYRALGKDDDIVKLAFTRIKNLPVRDWVTIKSEPLPEVTIVPIPNNPKAITKIKEKAIPSTSISDKFSKTLNNLTTKSKSIDCILEKEDDKYYVYDTTRKSKILCSDVKVGKHNLVGERTDAWFTLGKRKYWVVKYGYNPKYSHLKFKE